MDQKVRELMKCGPESKRIDQKVGELMKYGPESRRIDEIWSRKYAN